MADQGQAENTAFSAVLVGSKVGWHGIPMLAKAAMVELATINEMVTGHPVPRGDATRVLATLSAMTGIAYTLENVAICVIEENDDTTE